MGRRWIITIFILLVVSFLIWGQARWGMAAKDTRFYPLKILKKLDKVLENQDLILKELKALMEKR